MAKTPCGFCESTTHRITKEHVFGEWIGRLFGANQPDMIVRHTLKRDGVATPTRYAYGLDHQVRMACRQCNSGWMSALEVLVQPLIMPMIRGAGRRDLNLTAQLTIARWAMKTAMVAE